MKFASLFATLLLTSTAFAYEAQIKKGEMKADIDSMLFKASLDTGVVFEESQFQLIEERTLATSKYLMYVQTIANVPVAATAVRIWSHVKTGELILAEMHLDERSQAQSPLLAKKYSRAKFSQSAMKSNQLTRAIDAIVSSEVSAHATDNRVLGMKSQDQWLNGDLVRVIEVRGRRGVHHITISLLKNKVVEKNYIEFPQSENYHSLKANVYPIYEEVESSGEILPYEVRELKYIDSHIHDGGDAPLGSLTDAKFAESKYNPLMAHTKMGQALGLWSEATLRKNVGDIVDALPLRDNSVESGMLLQGKYATINLHPAVKEQFKDVNFALVPSTNHLISWNNNAGAWEATPKSGFFGQLIKSQEEVLNRIPVRLRDHNPVSYINNGFDEIQVYYGVTVLMEALAEMGFSDPGLSTEPFHAFLYDPDIAMKDNAYYYDNTINFTTYSPGSANYARDNATIWHELGHGVMDRIMGPHLGFSESKGGYGGLSEGMADFVAALVIEHQTNGATFSGKEEMRIVNRVGFYLTNELHDEGEAYGGVMKDMLDTVLKNEGKAGLHAFTDLTLEAMRLTRNHPALSARGWFEHMLYADEIGSEVRSPNQYREIITSSLSSRNFAFSSEFKSAAMTVTFNGTELTQQSPASREKPLSPCDDSGIVSFDLKLNLTAGDSNFITFPATIKVEYQKGALQGAIKWVGEESNPTIYEVASAEEMLNIPIKASMECQTVNQPDGSCKDYAYIQVWGQGDTKPRAKKRFYLQLNKNACLAK